MRKALNTFLAALMACAFSVSTPAPAQAQMAVIDPTNLAQNLLQATRALEQINNQIRQIEQATAMLRQNPLQLSPELSRSVDEARALFQSAQGIAFQVDALGENIRTLYPETWEAFDLDQVLARSDQWTRESRDALARAMQAEAHAAQALDRTRGRIDRALASSSSAEGQTGAIQASNQLLGIQATQLADIQALLIAQGRALETDRMEQLARGERAREIQRRAFPATVARSGDPARSAFDN